jgi:hypothetical protein
LFLLDSDRATKIFLSCLLVPVMRCFVSVERTAQVADEIAQVFRKVLIAHLVEVIAPLFIWHDNKAKHFFRGQRYSVLRLLW